MKENDNQLEKSRASCLVEFRARLKIVLNATCSLVRAVFVGGFGRLNAILCTTARNAKRNQLLYKYFGLQWCK